MPIGAFTTMATAMNFLGFNPMRALVVAGVVQGSSTPPLMLLLMRLTGDRQLMGASVNGRGLTILGWITTGCIFAATAGLVASWLL